MSTAARSERRLLGSAVFGDALNTETAPLIICLVFVVLLWRSLQSARLGEGPLGHVLLLRGVGTSLRHVPAGTYGARRCSQILQHRRTLDVTSVAH